MRQAHKLCKTFAIFFIYPLLLFYWKFAHLATWKNDNSARASAKDIGLIHEYPAEYRGLREDHAAKVLRTMEIWRFARRLIPHHIVRLHGEVAAFKAVRADHTPAFKIVIGVKYMQKFDRNFIKDFPPVRRFVRADVKKLLVVFRDQTDAVCSAVAEAKENRAVQVQLNVKIPPVLRHRGEEKLFQPILQSI